MLIEETRAFWYTLNIPGLIDIKLTTEYSYDTDTGVVTIKSIKTPSGQDIQDFYPAWTNDTHGTVLAMTIADYNIDPTNHEEEQPWLD